MDRNTIKFRYKKKKSHSTISATGETAANLEILNHVIQQTYSTWLQGCLFSVCMVKAKMCLRHYFRKTTIQRRSEAFQLSGKVTCNQSLQTPPINGDLLSLTFSSSENGIERKMKWTSMSSERTSTRVKVDGCDMDEIIFKFVLSFHLNFTLNSY